MDKNSTRNLGLTALVGLFAFYGFTANNLRIDSVSSSGIVVKYSKRGIASIQCPPTQTAIDETSVDSLSTSECVHHVDSKTLDNGDVEYTVTTYYKGHTASGTKVYPKQAVANFTNHNEDFIIGLIRKSKEKYDSSPEGKDPQVQLASASTTDAEVPPADEEDQTPDGETPEADAGISADTTAEEEGPAVAANGMPAITVPGSSDDSDSSDDSSADSGSLDAETLAEAIESYKDMILAYQTCQNDSSKDKDFKDLVNKYNAKITKYYNDSKAFETSDEEKSPFEKASTSNKRAFQSFVEDIEEMESDFSVSSGNSAADPSKHGCLLARNKEITDQTAKLDHFRKNIQPWLRTDMNNPASLEGISKAINENGNPISDLIKSDPSIRASVFADQAGAITQVRLTENSQKMANVAKSEPLRTQQLLVLKAERDLILSKHQNFLADLELKNPLIQASIKESSAFWMQQNGSFDFSSGLESSSTTPGTVTTDVSVSEIDKTIEQKALEQLEALRAVFDSHTGVTGSARSRVVKDMGSRNSPTKALTGTAVPLLDAQVGQSGSVQ